MAKRDVNHKIADSSIATPRAQALLGPVLLATVLLLAALAMVRHHENGANASATQAEDEQSPIMYVAISRLERAALALAEERGRTYAALHEPGALSQAQRETLEQRHAHTRSLLEGALQDLIAAQTRDAPFIVQRIRTVDRRLEQLRQEVSDIWSEPVTEQPSANATQRARLAAHWMLVATEVIGTVNDALVASRARLVSDDPVDRVRVAVQQRLWNIAEFAGRERAAVAALLTARATPDPAMQRSLTIYRARIEREWSQVLWLVKSAGMETQLKAQLAEVQRTLFEDVRSARQRIVMGKAFANEATSISSDRWFALATRSIESVIAVGQPG